MVAGLIIKGSDRPTMTTQKNLKNSELPQTVVRSNVRNGVDDETVNFSEIFEIMMTKRWETVPESVVR